MTTWDKQSNYYSGQGVVLIGGRTPAGRPAGLVPVGNCTALSIAVNTAVLQHKEAQSGNRSVDLRLTTETNAALSMTLESFDATALAIAMRATYTPSLGGTVTGQTGKLYMGKVAPFLHAAVSAVTVTNATGTPTALTAYTNDATPYDYKLNADAGSILINDGVTTPSVNLTAGSTYVPTVVTVSASAGAPTKITTTTPAGQGLVGDRVVVTGLAGADAALLNGKAFLITARAGNVLDLQVDTFGKTITIGTPKAAFDGDGYTVAYTYAAQDLVDALTLGITDRFLRFEGLNTADGNSPVIVEVFKFTSDPLKELALISDTVGQFVLEGNVLADPLQTSGSKYFRQILVK